MAVGVINLYGQLGRAQLENLSADASAGATTVGRIWWNTADGKAKLDDGTTVRAFLRNDDKLVIGNSGTASENVRINRSAASTLQLLLGDNATAEGSADSDLADWGILSAKVGGCHVQSYLEFAETSTPATPATNNLRLYGKDGKLYFIDDAGTERQVGSGSGGINYVTNPDIEGNADGYNEYTDAAGTAPVDGTDSPPVGGVVASRTTTSPLRGTGSLLIDKPTATDCQGQGVSFDVEIDSFLKGRRVRVKFQYEPAGDGWEAGTAIDDLSSFTVWAYDITNGTDPVFVGCFPGGTGYAHEFIGSFQAAIDSVDYRIIIHCSSAETDAFSLKIDEIEVSPEEGSAVVSRSEIILHGGNGFGSSGTAVRRFTTVTKNVGSAMTLTQSATNGDHITINEPGVYAIRYVDSDSNAAQTLGIILNSGASLTTNPQNFTSPTRLAYTRTDPNGAGNTPHETSVVTFLDAGDEIRFHSDGCDGANTLVVNARITQVMSLPGVSRSGRQVGFAVNPTQPTGTINSSENLINFGATATFDTHGGYDGAGVYTVKEAGVYSVTGRVTYNLNAGSGDALQIRVQQNGSTVAIKTVRTPTANTAYSSDIETKLYCAAGDTIRCMSLVSSAAAATYVSGSGSHHFSVVKVGGDASLNAANESVVARYSTNTAQSISNNTETIVNYDDKHTDTHNRVTTGVGTWNFRAPKDGDYLVTARIRFADDAGWAVGEDARLSLYVDGVLFSILDYKELTGSTTLIVGLGGSDVVPLAAGQTLDIRVRHTLGSALALDTQTTANFVAISLQ